MSFHHPLRESVIPDPIGNPEIDKQILDSRFRGNDKKRAGREKILKVIRMRFLLVIVMIIATALSGCVKAYPRINPAKPVEYIVTVRADRAWQDSHVRVKAGQVIKCKAEGQWNDHFNSYGPEGNPDIIKKHFGTNAPANSLIMQISNQAKAAYLTEAPSIGTQSGMRTQSSTIAEKTYFIGKESSIVAERSGEIRFRKNYSLPIGMEGEIKVKVKVCSDADADGVADYDEINLWKTNPLSPDSDGDGFTDLEEVTDMQQKSDDTIKQDEPAP